MNPGILFIIILATIFAAAYVGLTLASFYSTYPSIGKPYYDIYRLVREDTINVAGKTMLVRYRIQYQYRWLFLKKWRDMMAFNTPQEAMNDYQIIISKQVREIIKTPLAKGSFTEDTSHIYHNIEMQEVDGPNYKS